MRIEAIKELLSLMTEDINKNIKLIRKYFGGLNYKDDDNQSILHILVDNVYNEQQCLLAIKSALHIRLDPNLKADFGYNFIQTALYAGYSEKFILDITKEALKYGLNVNHRDQDGDNIMFTAIYSDNYKGEVLNLYKLLCENGFDSYRMDGMNRDLIEAMINQKQYSPLQIETFKKEYQKNTHYDIEVQAVLNDNEKNDLNNTTKDLIQSLINYYKIMSGITFQNDKEENDIKNILLEVINNKEIYYRNVSNRPILLISLIDKSFNLASLYEDKIITKKHFYESFEMNKGLDINTKEMALKKLK